METKATIDRFEGENAVILIGEDEYVVARATLPLGVVQGLWLRVEIEDKHIIKAIIDEEETAKVEKLLAERIARLKRIKQHQ